MKWVRLCAVAVAVCLASHSPREASAQGTATGFEGVHAAFGAAGGMPGFVEWTAQQEELPAGNAPSASPAVASPPTEPVPDGYITNPAGDGSNNLWSDALGCCRACCDAGVIAGVEATFLAPLNEPEQSVTLTDLIEPQASQGTSHSGFGGGVRTWVGLQRSGRGCRFQYWHFGDEEIDSYPNEPIDGRAAFVEAFSLKADTIDVELTQGMLPLFGWDIEASFGGRYARLERNGTVVGYGTLGGVDLTGLAVGANAIEGTGFTFSIGGRKPIWCSPWHTFWNYRGSLLWADTEAFALTQANAVSVDPGFAYSRDSAFGCSDRDLFMSEVRVGLEYQHCLSCLPATAFFRGGLEYQYWDTGSVRAGSNSFAFLQGGPPEIGGRVDARSNAHSGSLNLIGVVFGAGLTY